MRYLVFVLITFNLWATELYKPSFDCSKVAHGSIEYKICTDKELAQLDYELSRIYKGFYYLTKEIQKDQSIWLKKRNLCKDIDCIKESYQRRVQELTLSLSNAETFPNYILDAIKEAEESMEIRWNPIIYKDQQKLIDKGLAFKEELFRYKNIRFKPPLIENVQYNEKKLKKTLGVCYYYRFDLEVKEHSNNPKYIVDGQRYFVEDERKALRNINVSVWETTTEDKEWLFIKPSKSGSAFLVDPVLCKQERLQNNIVDALNYNWKQIKKSQFELYNASLVSYKGKEYIFDLFLIHQHTIKFKLKQVLGVTSLEDSTIQFASALLAIVPFKKIDKSQMSQGEK